MMSSETGLIVWYGQSFEGIAIAEDGSGMDEEARLRATPFGVYELTFRQQPHYEFSGAVFFNGDEPDPNGSDEQKQFEVIEDITGIERTLMIQSAGGGGISIEAVEIIPLDWRRNPLEFTQLEASASRRTIRYRDNPSLEALTMRISGLNVFDVESMTTCLWDQIRRGASFPTPQAAFITRPEIIRVDRLNNSRGTARSIEEHLHALASILSNISNGRDFELDCRYQYPIMDGGPEASVPALYPRLFDSGNQDAVVSDVAFGLKQWYGNASPEKGAFAFGAKFYSIRARQPAPVLYLSQLILPSDSMAMG